MPVDGIHAGDTVAIVAPGCRPAEAWLCVAWPLGVAASLAPASAASFFDARVAAPLSEPREPGVYAIEGTRAQLALVVTVSATVRPGGAADGMSAVALQQHLKTMLQDLVLCR